MGRSDSQTPRRFERPWQWITGWGQGKIDLNRLSSQSVSDSVVNVQEMWFGVYDGVTGLVTHPVSGFQRHSALGVLFGVGTGILSGISKTTSGNVHLSSCFRRCSPLIFNPRAIGHLHLSSRRLGRGGHRILFQQIYVLHGGSSSRTRTSRCCKS